MKKIIGTLLGLSLCLGNCPESHAFANNMTGFYLGPQVGFAMGLTKVRYRRSGFQDLNADLGMMGALGGLNIGYQKDTGTLVFGGEGYFNFGLAKGTVNDRQTDLKVNFKRTWGLGLAAKMGGKINRLTLYGKIAADYSNFQAKIQDMGSNGKGKKQLWGFGPGVGLEGMITKNLVLGAEYVFLTYSNKKFMNQIAGQPVTAKFRPMIGEFMVRMNIKLGG